MIIEATFTITFNGVPKNTEVEDLQKWSEGFRDSVAEFTEDLKRYIEKQAIIQSCAAHTAEKPSNES
ncbi:MAG: hypothetical protein QM813_26310 [Verrucomicrobiota bacterium]